VSEGECPHRVGLQSDSKSRAGKSLGAETPDVTLTELLRRIAGTTTEQAQKKPPSYKYRSGNEGRKHHGLVHPGYFPRVLAYGHFEVKHEPDESDTESGPDQEAQP
jgi:hypothetical protein